MLTGGRYSQRVRVVLDGTGRSAKEIRNDAQEVITEMAPSVPALAVQRIGKKPNYACFGSPYSCNAEIGDTQYFFLGFGSEVLALSGRLPASQDDCIAEIVASRWPESATDAAGQNRCRAAEEVVAEIIRLDRGRSVNAIGDLMGVLYPAEGCQFDEFKKANVLAAALPSGFDKVAMVLFWNRPPEAEAHLEEVLRTACADVLSKRWCDLMFGKPEVAANWLLDNGRDWTIPFDEAWLDRHAEYVGGKDEVPDELREIAKANTALRLNPEDEDARRRRAQNFNALLRWGRRSQVIRESLVLMALVRPTDEVVASATNSLKKMPRQ